MRDMIAKLFKPAPWPEALAFAAVVFAATFVLVYFAEWPAWLAGAVGALIALAIVEAFSRMWRRSEQR
jgi:hypothetical protein